MLQCSSTKHLDNNAILLKKNKILIDGESATNDAINELFIDSPNKTFIGVPFEIFFNQWAKKDPDSSFNAWLSKKEKRQQRWEKILSSKQLTQVLNYKKLGNQWLKGIGAPAVLLDSTNIMRNSNRLIQYFKNKGYFDATLTPEVIPTGRRKAEVRYSIQKGQQYRLDSIQFTIAARELEALVTDNMQESFLIPGEGSILMISKQNANEC